VLLVPYGLLFSGYVIGRDRRDSGDHIHESAMRSSASPTVNHEIGSAIAGNQATGDIVQRSRVAIQANDGDRAPVALRRDQTSRTAGRDLSKGRSLHD
jgi:hypothetical protein